MGILIGFIVGLFVPICLLLTIIILLQDSKGEGLSSSAFGGSEMQSILGGRGAASFLSKLTTWLAIGFIAMSLVLMRFYGDVKTGGLKPLETETTQSEAETDIDEGDEVIPDQEEAGTDGESGQAADVGDTGDAESDDSEDVAK